MALWFEEAAEFAGVEDIDIVEDTFIRQEIEEKEVKVYFSYNPPRNPYSWIIKGQMESLLMMIILSIIQHISMMQKVSYLPR